MNYRTIDVYNIFDHYHFVLDCAQSLKKYKDDKDAAKEAVRRDLMYCFWSKCEHEVLVCAWVDPRNQVEPLKIDVYQQVYNNWDIFFDYVWEHKKEIIAYAKAIE